MTVLRITPEQHLRAAAAVARAAVVAWQDGRESDAARLAQTAADRATDAAEDLALWRDGLSPAEAAQVIGHGSTPRTVAALAAEGRLSTVTTGGHGRIVEHSAHQYRDAAGTRRQAQRTAQA